jgi:hypothetical protein
MVRSMLTAIAVMSVALSGLACGDAGQPAAAPATVRPSPAAALPTAIPEVRLLGMRRAQRGLLLTSHWLVGGRLRDRAPGTRVRWPAPAHGASSSRGTVPSRRAASLRWRVATPSLPIRVELRTFFEGVDRRGVPRGTGRLVVCRRARARCRFAPSDTGVAIRLTPSDRHPTRVVLSCEWYIPPALRPAGTEDNPVISASWGFRPA